jgi:TP53 regulating kinase and related kinases
MPALSKDVRAQVEATRLPPILSLIENSQLIKQGAEAVRRRSSLLSSSPADRFKNLQKVYKSTLFPFPLCTPSSSSAPPPPALPVLLKHRFPKTYRHSTLDALLTRQRVTGESRALVRCLKAGVKVPGLRCVDVKQGVLGMEWIEGWSVREVLGGGQEGDELPDDEEQEEEEPEDVEEMLKGLGVDHGAFLLLAVAPEYQESSYAAYRAFADQ